MSTDNIIVRTIAKFGRDSGFVRKSGSWFLRQEESIAVVEPQKSDLAPRYYLNVALWLLPLGDAKFPKEWTCQVRTRLESLVPDKEERLKELLDLENDLAEDTRAGELTEILDSTLLPVVRAAATIEGLRSPTGRRLLDVSLVNGPAQRLLGLSG